MWDVLVNAIVTIFPYALSTFFIMHKLVNINTIFLYYTPLFLHKNVVKTF